MSGGPSWARSAELHARATQLIPGGVNSPVRAMRAIGRDPIFIAGGEGAEIVDVDGNRYIDWVCSWGPLIAGHAHPEVVEAVTRAAGAGTTYGAPTEAEVDLAAEVVERMPGVEMLRMVSSGTEATMSAIRVARAVTGRERVLKFAGAYHGHVDGLLAEAGSGLATAGMPASPGVPGSHAALTHVVRWNDRDAVKLALTMHDMAAVLVEPYPANMGLVPPDDGFLEYVRNGATANGAVLIFDEVITGFRVARGGAQEREDVVPDMTVLGKVLGGGLPAAAYGGSERLMKRVAPAGDVYQAGTLAGNPVATAAGLATLGLLDADAYQRLARLSERLAAGLSSVAADAGVELNVTHAPGLLTPFFQAAPVTDYEDAKASDTDRHAAFCRALLARGVYPPASQFEAWFPSLAHTDEHVERTIAAAREAFAEVAR